MGFLGRAAALPLGSAKALAQSAPPEPKPSERMAMGEAARGFMDKYLVPGFSVAVGHSGRLVYRDAFGWAERDAHEPVTPSHLFRIGSISKPITSVAIFKLIEEGHLSLADRVFGAGALLGADFGPPPFPRFVEDITIEHLLTHSCGGWGNRHDDPMSMKREMDHAQLIAWTVRNQALTNMPGRVYAYSNFGFCLLGRVIEKITKRPYEDFVINAVLRGCGIDDMVVGGNTLMERRPGEVKYYGQNGENPYGMNLTRLDSVGGWIATPTDLVQFAMHVSGFRQPASILKAWTIAAMTAPSAPNSGYAKGWEVNRAGNWWHFGTIPGSKSIMVRARGGFCWAAIANSRDTISRNSIMSRDLNRLMWTMVRLVKAWHA